LGEPGDVTTGAREACNETALYWSGNLREHDRNRLSLLANHNKAHAGRENNIGMRSYEFRCDRT
jgi:hypothetical protein